jgi:hypothetical protein
MHEIKKRNLESLLSFRRTRISRMARHVNLWDGRHQELKSRFEELHSPHGQNSKSEGHQHVMDWFLILAFPAAYIIDVALLYPVLDFLVNPIFQSDTARTSAAFLIPLAVIGLDSCFCAQRVNAKENLAPGHIVFWWSFWSVLFALALPAAVVATFAISNHNLGLWPSAGLLAMMIVLSLGGHVAILFGGRRTFEAFNEKHTALMAALLRWRAGRAQHKRLKWTQRTAEEVNLYSSDLTLHGRDDDHRQQTLGPFDAVTEKTLLQMLGRGLALLPLQPQCNLPAEAQDINGAEQQTLLPYPALAVMPNRSPVRHDPHEQPDSTAAMS